MLQEPTDPVSGLGFGMGFALDLGFFCFVQKCGSQVTAERSHSVVCGTLSTTSGKHFKKIKLLNIQTLCVNIMLRSLFCNSGQNWLSRLVRVNSYIVFFFFLMPFFQIRLILE